MEWAKPTIHEALATLYFRLSGYFTTGLIQHSPNWGQNQAEIDCLAIRHPNHSQPDRCVDAPPFLAIQKGEVDLIICETKSNPQLIEFNESLRNDLETICFLLRWAGVFADEGQIKSVAERLQPLLQPRAALEVVRSGIVESGCRVRPLLCCPPCPDADSANRWYLVESEIFRFVNECFNPQERRPTCSTRYNFRLWGHTLMPLVEYFKKTTKPTLAGLYSELGVV